MDQYDVIVIGAGPAGLLAAGRAAELGGKVLMLEKMGQEGRKLLITGQGRCNITNNAPIGDFINHVYPDGRFLRHAFSKFFSPDIIKLLEKYGVKTMMLPSGRYFPASNKSADVLKALLKWVHELKVEIRRNHRVEKLLNENGAIKGVVVNSGLITAGKVILSTGGKSYPATGSNGEGYELAREVGHNILTPHPALVPLVTKGRPTSSAVGRRRQQAGRRQPDISAARLKKRPVAPQELQESMEQPARLRAHSGRRAAKRSQPGCAS